MVKNTYKNQVQIYIIEAVCQYGIVSKKAGQKVKIFSGERAGFVSSVEY